MTKRIKILLFSDAEREAGAEKYLFSLLQGLSRDRFALQLACSSLPNMDGFARKVQQAGIPVHRVPPVKTLGDFAGLLRLWIFFLFHRYPIIHFNLTHPRACNAAIVAATLAGQRRILVTDHLPQVDYGGGRIPLRHRLACKWIRHRIVLTQALKELLSQRGFAPQGMSVVYNGVDTSFHIPAGSCAKKREDLGLGEEHLVGMVGRLVEQKGFPYFLKAAAWVKERYSPVRFLVIGGGEEEAKLRKMVLDLNLEKDVLFLGDRNDVAKILSILHVSVLTSLFEGLPFTILESMAAARPVVASDIDGMREIVVPGVTGILVPPRDSEATGAAILELLREPKRAEEMGQQGKRLVEERFSLRNMVEKTEEVYERMMR